MNIGAPWPDLEEAESRVRGMQSKLHQWAVADPDRRFGGLQQELKSRRYAPTRVREKVIPKTAGKVRRLGIPTAADRVVRRR